MDPFCLFAILPMLIVAGFLIVSDLASLGIVLIVLTLLIVLVDSWANRPLNKDSGADPAPRRR